MSNIRILLVEDDPNLGEILREYLEAKKYECELSKDGEAGLKLFKREQFDLCIFDVMMPRMDGFTLAEEVRIINSDIPIIFLTAKSMKEDTIQGFKVGADDYIAKPFSMEELLLRIQAVLRRTRKEIDELEKQTTFQVGKYTFHYDRQVLTDESGEQKLTSKESELLKMLCVYKNQVLDRSKALKRIWLDDNYFNSRSMDVYVTKLRKYLKGDSRLQIINIHGQGFKLLEMSEEQAS